MLLSLSMIFSRGSPGGKPLLKFQVRRKTGVKNQEKERKSRKVAKSSVDSKQMGQN